MLLAGVLNHKHFGKTCGSSLKTKHIPVLWPRKFTPMYVTKKMTSRCPHINLYKYTPNSFNNLEKTQITRESNIKTVVYAYNRITQQLNNKN